MNIVENHRPASSCNYLCLHLLSLARTSPPVSVLNKLNPGKPKFEKIKTFLSALLWGRSQLLTGLLGLSVPDRLRADGIVVLLDVIDYYLIIVKVNLKERGFTEFTKITLPLHILSFAVYYSRFFLKKVKNLYKIRFSTTT